MDVRLNISRDYEKKTNRTLGENKPNSKPIPNQRTEGRRRPVLRSPPTQRLVRRAGFSEEGRAELDNGSKNWAALLSACKKTLLFALNLVKWTLGEEGKSKIKSQSAK